MPTLLDKVLKEMLEDNFALAEICSACSNLMVPVVPEGQLVQTTSLVLITTAQVAPAGQGHG